MMQALKAVAGGRGVVLVVAAPAEVRAVLAGFGAAGEAPAAWTRTRVGPGVDLIVTGVGKANAAGACGRLLRPEDGVVLNVGVAGALPGSGLELRAVVAAGESVFADEGVLTPGGFVDCGRLGFPPGDFAGMSPPTDPRVLAVLAEVAGVVGGVATVSTCSGTGALAGEVVARTGAVAECMEGAAVLLAASRLGLAGGELRVISNTTGDRERQVWDLAGALGVLTVVLGR